MSLLTILALSSILHAEQAPRYLHLDGMILGQVPEARPGPHQGPLLRFGDRNVQATWDASLLLQPPRLMALDAEGEFDLETRKELIILTSFDLASQSQVLPRFIDFREAEGWTVRLVTEEEWDLSTGAPTDGAADRIRAFLARGWASTPGAFLLLIGDPSPHADVPMKEVHPLVEMLRWYPDWLQEEMDPIPTDFYYADLNGDWDCDGDGDAGEYPDDAGPGCVDFGPELVVGRIPVYDGDAESMDLLLERALDHDMEQDKSYRRQTLLPGAFVAIQGAADPVGGSYDTNMDGAGLQDAVARDLPDAFTSGVTRLFEDEGLVTSTLPHEGPLSVDEVVKQWGVGRGMVIWSGHGGSQGAYRMIWSEDLDADGIADENEFAYPAFMESGDARSLTNVPGAFTYHMSCDNGYAEDPQNIGVSLLYGGAAATATASRVAFGDDVGEGGIWEPRPDLMAAPTAGYYYALKVAEGMTVGEALAWTKYALPGDGWEEAFGDDFASISWTTRFEYNLYGDPTRSLEMCAGNSVCDDGNPCNGAETCDDGFCVHHDPIDCTSMDGECVVGSCDPQTGACVTEPRIDGAPCDDGAWCSEADTCVAGACSGAVRDCGTREGYTSSCDESIQACTWSEDPVVREAEPKEGGCSATPQRPVPLLGALGLLMLTLVNRRRN